MVCELGEPIVLVGLQHFGICVGAVDVGLRLKLEVVDGGGRQSAQGISLIAVVQPESTCLRRSSIQVVDSNARCGTACLKIQCVPPPKHF